MTASREAAAKLLNEANIRPKTFLGGSPNEYRLVLGKGSTLLSEHIASGRKVPAVEAGPALKGASTVLRSTGGSGSALAATATIAAVATVYGVVRARRLLRENQALRAELSDRRQSESVDLDQEIASHAGSPQSQDEVAPPDCETAWQPGGSILTAQAHNLAPVDRGSIKDRLRPEWPEGRTYPPTPPALQPRTTSANDASSPALEARDGEEVDLDVLPPGLAVGDESQLLGVVVDATASSGSTDAAAVVKVDWVETVERQVEAARGERDQGRTEDGVGRLRLLLFFLDNVLVEERSPLYPDITVEPLIALVELSLEQAKQKGSTSNTSPAITDWMSRLRALAAETADEKLRHRLQVLESSRLWHEP
ncbi:hypothetical protein ACFP3Q_14480 [Nocardioides sp. GCM10027113]|uniref:hypothetical protein n=1 Tax=unclassified Nocardioides TaxID=2615069 RepID=UPI003619EF1E